MIKEPQDLIKQQSTDAMEWAKMFVKTKNEQKWTLKDINEGLLVSWFASAIVTAQDKMQSDIYEVENGKS